MKPLSLIPMLLAALAAALGAQAQSPVQVTQLAGKPVVNANGASVGEFYDVAVDTEEGRVAFVIISVGMRLVPIALPSTELMIDPSRIVLTTDRARLDATPTFDASAAAPRVRPARELFGGDLRDQQGADIGDVKDLVFNPADGAIASVVVAFDRKWHDQEGWVALPRASVRHQGRDLVANFKREDMRPASVAQAEQRSADAARAAALSPDRDERATTLIGQPLVDAKGQPLGTVTDLSVEAGTGRIAQVLVGAGGGGMVALPLPAKGLTRDGGKLVLEAGAAGLAPPQGDAKLKRASDLMKAKLADTRGKDVGRLHDLVVNLAAGKVHYAVAEFDPSWVQAGKVVAIRFPPESMRVELNDLMGAMIFDQGGWPDLNNPQYLANIDQYLGKR
jgi:sporulation protein YlmC with PRC-barrel domain